MRDYLEYIFSNINDWLKFAEAKSATLLAANGVVLFGILRLVKGYEFNHFTAILVVISCMFIFSSLILTISSFIPSIKMPWIHKKSNVSEGDNLLFFSDIENYTPRAYLKKLKLACGYEKEQDDVYLNMLSEQIITNSVIASYKFSVFKKSIFLTVIGMIIAALGAIIHYFW
jgi:hypothetical protein